MKRMFSVIVAALALATCLAFASPASAVALDHPTSFDDIAYHLAIKPVLNGDLALANDADLFVLASAAVDSPEPVNCSSGPAWMALCPA